MTHSNFLNHYLGHYFEVNLDLPRGSIVPQVYYGRLTGDDDHFIELSSWSTTKGIFDSSRFGEPPLRPFFTSGKPITVEEAIAAHEHSYGHVRPVLLAKNKIVRIEHLIPALSPRGRR